MKKLFCILLSIFLLLGLCACGENGNQNTDDVTPETPETPDSICGTWYPMPEVSDIPVEIYADGTCVLNGESWSWVAKSVEEDTVVLTVGEGAGQFELAFKYLTSGLPVLAGAQIEWAVKDAELWNLMTEWYSEEMKSAFTLSLVELLETGCRLEMSGGMLIVETPEGYTLEAAPDQCVVTDPEGNSTVYVPIDGGAGDSPDYGDTGDFGDDLDAAMAKYYQAMQDLQSVLETGKMTAFTGNEGKVLRGSAAIEHLYRTFLSLQNYVDVSQELMCIQKVDNVLVETQWTTVGIDSYTSKVSYDAFGNKLESNIPDAVNAGEAVYTYIHENGKPWAVIWGGIEGGEAVYDSNGRITALKKTNPGNGKVYTAPITYDAQGRIVRVDVPFVLSVYEEENETDFTEYCTFLYDNAGRLLQSSLTRECHSGVYEPHEFYQEFGFCNRTVTEYYYDANGKLEKTIDHNVEQASDGTVLWSYSEKVYTYNAAGKLVSDHEIPYRVTASIIGQISTPREEILRMNQVQAWVLNNTEFVDSVAKDFIGQIEGHYEDYSLEWNTEYKYGSIYIFKAEE